MDKKKQMIIFGSGVGGVALILVVVLIVVLLNNKSAQPVGGQSDASGEDSSVTSDSDYEPDTSGSEGETTGAASDTTASGSSSSATNGTGNSVVNKTTTTSKGNTTTKAPSKSDTYSLLADPKFENGFKVLGMSTGDGGSNGSFTYDPMENYGRPSWNLAQWGSRYSFADSKHTQFSKLSNNIFKITNTTKEFTVDTNTGRLIFTGLASKCYDAPRTGSEPWLHILVEQRFKTSQTKVSELGRVDVTMSNRLLKFDDSHMGDDVFNPNAHAAQFLMYFSVANIDTTSDDINQFIWFGFPLFDNRTQWINSSSMYDKGTSSLMVGIGNKVLYEKNGKNNCWKNGKVNAGPNVAWSNFSLDVLPLIKSALDTAHRDGYLVNTSLNQLAITGMNLGWEIPGTYDASMEMKDFSVMITKK